MKRKTLLLLTIMALLMPLAMWGQKTLPYEYGFENYDLYGEGWTMGGSSFYLGITEGTGHSGNCFFQFYGTGDQYQYLVSPELSATTNGTLVEFYYMNNMSSFPQTFQVGYSTTGNSISDFSYGDEVITASNKQWSLYSKSFPNDTKYISIRRNSASQYLYVDDFIFDEYSEYPAPKNLVVTGYASSTATLDWSARSGQDHWDIFYSTNSTAPTSNTTPQVSNTDTKPYTLTGLTSGITYYAYVRGNYNNGEHYSDWSNACTFEVGCFTPTIDEAMASCNQAYISWIPVGSETSWQVAFSDQQGFDPESVTPETVTLQYYVHEELATGVTYYAHVRAVCGEGDYSDWSDEVSMTTECFAPSNLQESSVTPTTATLSWRPGSSELQWQISYSTTENFTPENGTMITVDADPYTLSGLTVNTQYYAYVRAVCGENIYSDWSDIGAFMPKYELTVGDDETNYNMYVPFYGSFVSYATKSQFIIPASTLTDLLYANINKLTFYAGVGTANFGNATFDVLISELDGVTVFENSDFFDWSTMTSVYSGSISVSNNKMEITLNNPYQYMGGDLLIGFNQTNSGNDVTAYWYGAATTGYSAYGGMEASAYSYSDYSRYKFIPKTTFSYTPGSAPTCIKPSNLSISQTSGAATLTWTAGDDETHWNVQYKEASASEWSAVITVENTPTCTLNNLSPITSYQVRVQADCGGGDTSGWIAGAFTTSCGPTNAPYSHDFDSDATGSSAAFPQCWTKVNDSDDPSYNYFPYITTGNSHSGLNCLFFMRLYNYTALNQIAVLPEMNADVRTLQLSFYARLGSSTNQPLSVGVMTDPDDATTFVKIEDVTIASSEYAQYTVSFDTYEGVGHYIALKCERANVYNQIYVDDIEVTANSVCFAPENPQITDVTAHSAVFTWTPGSEVTNWQVQYKKTSDTDWSESITVSPTPSYTFSNLLAATEYEARVRTVCGTDDYSDWVASETFTTDCDYMELPYSHDFESDATGHVAPTCWHFSDGTYPYIYESNTHAHSGNHYLQIKKNSNYAATLVLPEIDTDEHPIGTLQLTFWAKTSQSTYYYDYLYAGVITDPNDMTTFQYVQDASTRITSSTYKKFEFYFDNWSGEGNYIALRYAGDITYYIDDIEVSVAPTCRQPLDLSSNTTYAHEAYISWKTTNANYLDYQVSYSTTEGFNPDNGTIVDVHFDSPLSGTMYRDYQLTCLNAETTYYFYVRTKCGEDEYSDWSADYSSFTTDIACPAPYINDINPKHTVADIYWYGNEDDEWDFQYKESSSDEWITPTDFSTIMGAEMSLVYRLTGLTPDTEYDIRLRQHCGMYSCPEVDDGYSDWATDYFTTGYGCWYGTPWMCTSHLGTKAALMWRNDAEATRWQIRYRLESEEEYPEGNIVTTEVLPEKSLQKYVVEGLQPNSTYYWEVRGYCDENTQGEWSTEDYFYTHSTDGYITVEKSHPYYEDFEDGMPDDWGRMNLYNYDMNHYDTWECINATSSNWEALPATKCISSCRESMSWASPGSMILMPAIHIDENATSAMLSFWSRDAYNASDARGTKMIWVNGDYLSTEYTAFDYGNIYQKSSKAGYWRKCFVNLDDYIGKTIIIAFDYVVTHNYNNYDWWVDDVRVEVFDNVFGGGDDITQGNWNDPTMWGGGSKSRGIPTANDDVLISASVTIPEGFVAEANKIVLNIDTTSNMKYGKIIINNGGQLVTNNPVDATIEKPVTSWDSSAKTGWYAITSPVCNQKFEAVENLTSESYDHNIYRYDEPTFIWQEYRNEANEFDGFINGRGYLYRTMFEGNIGYTGTINSGDVELPLTYTASAGNLKGFNLIGNPYPHNIYKGGENAAIPNSDLLEDKYCVLGVNGNWVLTDDGTAITPGTAILVQAKAQGELTMRDVTTGAAAKRGENDNIWFTVSNDDYEDVACVEFREGRGFNKMAHYNTDVPMLYIRYNGEDFASVDVNDDVKMLNLCFKAKAMGKYTLSYNANGQFSYLHLIDRLTGNDVDMLVENEYSFIGTASDNANRFIVKLNYNGDNSDENFVYQSGDDIVVSGEGELQVYDVMGRMIASQRVNGVETVRKPDQTGVYIMKLNEKTQKIVVR